MSENKTLYKGSNQPTIKELFEIIKGMIFFKRSDFLNVYHFEPRYVVLNGYAYGVVRNAFTLYDDIPDKDKFVQESMFCDLQIAVITTCQFGDDEIAVEVCGCK